MDKRFWHDLASNKKPFFALAPMEKATDTIFRQVIAEIAKPDVFFTEFTNVEGLFSKGRTKIERRLKFTNIEKPIIAQLWGLDLVSFYKAAQLVSEMGFTGIDINMGCPESNVTAKGACAGLIRNPSLASQMISAVKSGAGNLPVSVKTRLGFTTIQTEEWIGFLLKQNLDAIIIHGRTRKEMSKVPAHWDEIGRIVKMRDTFNKNTVIIGNGDVKSVQQGTKLAEQYAVDGIMIGRGVFENERIFSTDLSNNNISVAKRISTLKRHLDLYEAERGEKLPFNTLKKYFKIYIRDFDGASEFRAKLMDTKNVKEANHIISTANLIS